MNALNQAIDTAPKSGEVLRVVFVIAGVLLLAALAYLSTSSGNAASTLSFSQAAPPAAAVPAVAVAPSDTGVPDATTVFRGPVEEPGEASPTF